MVLVPPSVLPAALLPPSDGEAQGSPRYWLRVLTNRLMARQHTIRRYERYYEGEHPLEYATPKFTETFGTLFSALADNWCEVVVDAVEERLNVDGFRFGDEPEADQEAWEIWQRSCMDADSQLAHIDSLVTGYGYALVWADGDGKAKITVESPTQAICAHRAGSRRDRVAGLKQWRDDDGFLKSVVYLPDGVYKFRSAAKVDDGAVEGQLSTPSFWEPYEERGERWPLDNPLKKVSLVPIYNRPRTSRAGAGQSEIKVVLPLQDAVNKLLADLILASEYGAFRQRWLTGLTLERDDKGNVKNPFEHGPGKLWVAEGQGMPGETAQFGEFGETNLGNVVNSIVMIVQHMASQSRTPPHYLDASADRLSGESIKAAETGLVAKVHRHQRHKGESWEEVMRLCFAVEEDAEKADAYDAETIWGDPETRTEAEHVDAVSKKQALNVPQRQLWEDLGYSQQQIARFIAEKMQEDLRKSLLAPPPPVVVTAPAGSPNGQGAPPVGGGAAPQPQPQPEGSGNG